MRLEINAPLGRVVEFRWLWAKPVRGFDPSRHCASCLVGAPDPRVRAGMDSAELELEAVPGEAFYVCGVHPTLRLELNAHLAVEPADGEVAQVQTPGGVWIRVHGARALPIPPLDPGWRDLPRLFTRCRNFQFGVDRYGYPEGRRPRHGDPVLTTPRSSPR